MKKAIEKIGKLERTKAKTLEKDTFIKVFKYTGDYAKFKSKEIKLKAQE